MRIIPQQAQLIKKWNKMDLYQRCEYAGRISHLSSGGGYEKTVEFIKKMVEYKHEGVFEFARVVMGLTSFPPDQRVSIRTLRAALRYPFLFPEGYELVAKLVQRKYPLFFEDFDQEIFEEFTEPHRQRYGWLEEGDAQVKNLSLDWIPVHITTNRAISHQIVRYRNEVVYLQESQRYCKYKGDVIFIDSPEYFPEGSQERYIWENFLAKSEEKYNELLEKGVSAQAARLVLPNSTKTELIMYASPKTWLHFFDQRCTQHADKMMYTLACNIRKLMRNGRILYHG